MTPSFLHISNQALLQQQNTEDQTPPNFIHMSISLATKITTCRQLRELGKYTQAITSLETLLGTNQDDLMIRGELAETLAAQGYIKKAFDLVGDGLKATRSPGKDEKDFVYLKMQWCLYAVYVNCSFDVAVACAAEVYRMSLSKGEESGVDMVCEFVLSSP
jgi:hypothetical protein